MSESWQAVIDALGGPGAVFSVVVSSATGLYALITRQRERARRLLISTDRNLIEELQKTRLANLAVDKELRAQNSILWAETSRHRAEADSWRAQFHSATEDLARATINHIEQEQKIVCLHQEVEKLREEVKLLRTRLASNGWNAP